jgi:hypothetical protein
VHAAVIDLGQTSEVTCFPWLSVFVRPNVCQGLPSSAPASCVHRLDRGFIVEICLDAKDVFTQFGHRLVQFCEIAAGDRNPGAARKENETFRTGWSDNLMDFRWKESAQAPGTHDCVP